MPYSDYNACKVQRPRGINKMAFNYSSLILDKIQVNWKNDKFQD